MLSMMFMMVFVIYIIELYIVNVKYVFVKAFYLYHSKKQGPIMKYVHLKGGDPKKPYVKNGSFQPYFQPPLKSVILGGGIFMNSVSKVPLLFKLPKEAHKTLFSSKIISLHTFFFCSKMPFF